MRFIVLGGYGIIGKEVVKDLFKFAKNSEIIIAGRNWEKAKEYASLFKSKKVKALEVNIADVKSLFDSLRNSDVCINCVQYYFNVQIMDACLKAKTNYVDLGGLFHTTKKQLKLFEKFRKINKIAILGCGASPGITNILASYGSKFLGKINSVEIVFADIDKTKYNQKFILPYSFKTIVDEFTLNPAVFENGKTRFVNPLSGFKEYDFGEKFGRQKSFYSLHSEIATLPFFLKEKGLKNCEFRVTFDKNFVDKIKMLVDLGFTNQEKINLINIFDATAEIMERNLPKPKTKIIDQELLRVIFDSGRLILDAKIFSDHNVSAGILDTAVPCSIAAQMIANHNGLLDSSGVFPPEKIINPENFFQELKKREIYIYKNRVKI